MRVRWVKVWVDSLATLTERFRDDEGRVDFEAIGREEYAFRHALLTGDFSRSERARDLYDATINEITSRSEAGRKGAEARWSKNTAAAPHREDVDVRANGCNISQDATNGNAGDERSSESNSVATVNLVHPAPNMRRVPQNEAPAHGFSGGRTAQGTMSHSPEAAAQSGKDYDQEAETISTRASNPPKGKPIPTPQTGNNSNGPRQAEAPQSRRAGENSLRVAKVSTPPVRSSGPAKRPHGEFGNVMLTDDEFSKLCEKCPDADSLITELDQYIESQGKTKKYKSHYATLLNWSRRKAQEAKPKQGYLTSDDISKKNYQESKARLEAMFAKGRETA